MEVVAEDAELEEAEKERYVMQINLVVELATIVDLEKLHKVLVVVVVYGEAVEEE